MEIYLARRLSVLFLKHLCRSAIEVFASKPHPQPPIRPSAPISTDRRSIYLTFMEAVSCALPTPIFTI